MAYTNQVRIIAGKYRSRALHFKSSLHLKPTGSRIRETLFNWLMHDIVGAHCLDAFAGSGVLGVEALSRGAKNLVFIENSVKTSRALKQNLADFQLEDQTEVYTQDTLAFLREPCQQAFDLVFLDPPFKRQDLVDILTLLLSSQYLKSSSKVYIEFQKGSYAFNDFSPLFSILKHKTIGEVTFALLGRV